jgi:hypothetical protein
MSSSVRSVSMRVWLSLLGVLAWISVLLDNATTSFCLTIPCCRDVTLVEGNPITHFFIGVFGLDAALLINCFWSLLAILWIYERVTASLTNRSIWIGSLVLTLLILIRGAAAINNWNIFVQAWQGNL